MKKFAFASLVAAACLCAAGSVSAQDYRIAYGDLDLSSNQGAATLDARIRQVARRACQGRGSRLEQMQCAALFKNEALDQLPQARRDDYARARRGQTLLAQVSVFTS